MNKSLEPLEPLLEKFLRNCWLDRIESAMSRAHDNALECHGLDSYEEVYCYDGLDFMVHHRNAVWTQEQNEK